MSRKMFAVPMMGMVSGLMAANVHAVDLGGIEIHGFFTAGATTVDADVSYLRSTDEDVRFDEDTVLGLQVIAPVSDKVMVQGQLVANGSRQPDVDFDIKLDWAFVSYQINDNLVVRGGKIRYPGLLFSETNEVGYTYPWVRSPQTVYGAVPFNAVDGLDMRYTASVGNDLELTLQPFVGTFSEDVEFFGDLLELSLDDIVGFNVSLGDDAWTVQAGALDTEASIEATPFQGIDISHYSIGAKYEGERAVGYFEYFKTDFEGGEMFGFGSDRDGWYGTFGYRFGKLLPHLTIGERDSSTPGAVIGDTWDEITLGLRYELADSAALKFDWTQAEPTNGLNSPFGGSLDDDHGNIFSIALDVVF